MVVPVKFEANVFVGCTAGVDWFVPNTEVPDESKKKSLSIKIHALI
jgi:hypothetical protein